MIGAHNPWTPTHRIITDTGGFLVMADDCSLYTKIEWDFYLPAEYELSDDGVVYLNGCRCSVMIDEL